jgi:hypothetical protein
MAKGQRGKTVRRAKTSKSAKGSAMSIPQLRKGLDHITDYTESLVKSGVTSTKQLAKQFAAEWHKVFGKRMSLSTAESYIKHMMGMKGKPGKKGTRKLRGGSQSLAGAPMAALTRPGTDLPYGNFLEYVSKGFWNPEPAIKGDTGRDQSIALPYAGTGSNKISGGGLLSSLSNGLSAISFRPFQAENPSSPQQDMMSAWKGQGMGPGPESWQQTWTPRLQPGAAPNPTLGVFQRELTRDVTTR